MLARFPTAGRHREARNQIRVLVVHYHGDEAFAQQAPEILDEIGFGDGRSVCYHTHGLNGSTPFEYRKEQEIVAVSLGNFRDGLLRSAEKRTSHDDLVSRGMSPDASVIGCPTASSPLTHPADGTGDGQYCFAAS